MSITEGKKFMCTVETLPDDRMRLKVWEPLTETWITHVFSDLAHMNKYIGKCLEDAR